MPANFFSNAWPIAYVIVILAACTVAIAALTTLVVVVTRVRQLVRYRRGLAKPGEVVVNPFDRSFFPHPTRFAPWGDRVPGVMETTTTDGVHFNIIP